MRKGMRIGGKHKWEYHQNTWKEIKTGPKSWNFVYEQTKTRKGSWAKKGQGMPTGSKLIWKIKAKQYAIKTGPNTYKLVMKGKKYREKWKVPKRKWMR